MTKWRRLSTTAWARHRRSRRQRGRPTWTEHTIDLDSGVGLHFEIVDLNGDGIRSDPYSTDATIYKRTYADINDASTSCQVKTCSDDPTETCNTDADCSGNPPPTSVTLRPSAEPRLIAGPIYILWGSPCMSCSRVNCPSGAVNPWR